LTLGITCFAAGVHSSAAEQSRCGCLKWTSTTDAEGSEAVGPRLTARLAMKTPGDLKTAKELGLTIHLPRLFQTDEIMR
jgi:hypothetical protein